MSTHAPPLNWWAIAALYAALLLGIVAMLVWGDYRNATWLSLIGAGGGCTAYARLLEAQGRAGRARWWKRGGALFYLVFFAWAGTVLLQTL
jgi:hypothetical protein